MLEKESLTEVLAFTKCTELPKAQKKTDIFVRAIVLVRKANNHEAYCVAENDGSGNPSVVKSCGSLSIIKEVLEIYPLSVLETSVIPNFRKKADIVQFLVKCGEDEKKMDALASDTSDAAKAELKNLVYKYCIKHQLQREKLEAKAEARDKTPESPAATTEEGDNTQTTETPNAENNGEEANTQSETSEDGEAKEPTGEAGNEEETADSDF